MRSRGTLLAQVARPGYTVSEAAKQGKKGKTDFVTTFHSRDDRRQVMFYCVEVFHRPSRKHANNG